MVVVPAAAGTCPARRRRRRTRRGARRCAPPARARPRARTPRPLGHGAQEPPLDARAGERLRLDHQPREHRAQQAAPQRATAGVTFASALKQPKVTYGAARQRRARHRGRHRLRRVTQEAPRQTHASLRERLLRVRRVAAFVRHAVRHGAGHAGGVRVAHPRNLHAGRRQRRQPVVRGVYGELDEHVHAVGGGSARRARARTNARRRATPRRFARWTRAKRASDSPPRALPSTRRGARAPRRRRGRRRRRHAVRVHVRRDVPHHQAARPSRGATRALRERQKIFTRRRRSTRRGSRSRRRSPTRAPAPRARELPRARVAYVEGARRQGLARSSAMRRPTRRAPSHARVLPQNT